MSGSIVTTKRLPVRDRKQFWRAIVDEYYVRVDLDLPETSQFHGSLRHRTVGSLQFTHYCATANRAERRRRDIAQDTCDNIFCFLPQKGEMVFWQAGREARAVPGTICLIDGAAPFKLHQPSNVDVRVSRLPRGPLEGRMADLSAATCRTVPIAAGLPRLAASFLTMTSREAGELSDTPLISSKVADQALDLIALSFQVAPGDMPLSETTVRNALYRRALEHIDARLGDEDFKASDVAARLGVSQRYLQSIFAGRGQTLRATIQDRRLDAAKSALSNPCYGHRNVAEIAHAFGFRSQAHFSRVFKRRHGVRPSDCRAATH